MNIPYSFSLSYSFNTSLKQKTRILHICNIRAHSASYLTGGLQAVRLLSPTLRCTVLRLHYLLFLLEYHLFLMMSIVTTNFHLYRLTTFKIFYCYYTNYFSSYLLISYIFFSSLFSLAYNSLKYNACFSS